MLISAGDYGKSGHSAQWDPTFVNPQISNGCKKTGLGFHIANKEGSHAWIIYGNPSVCVHQNTPYTIANHNFSSYVYWLKND